ncbi:MAG: LysM peptidoglycan-binding domain-containing protein [Candidatus Electrothrix sp. AR1]|nr:LysM peptidoglycan-binding domain-containing protein [Candidatus Electrothrix sp. AR1]
MNREKGELQKMLILAFADSETTETGGQKEANEPFEVLINPESYTVDYKFNYANSDQGHGTSGKQLKYLNTEPLEMSFEFLFDGTGIIDGEWRTKKGNPPIDDKGVPQDSIVDRIREFKRVLLEYKGDSHEPRHLKLVWGDSFIFSGRATEVSINYKLFKPDGTPIRAIAKVKIKSSVEETKRALQENRKSADLTHRRQVKAGDTLPLMCHRIYGDPKYYLDVARVNGLHDFRSLRPGTNLVFPPLQKTAN